MATMVKEKPRAKKKTKEKHVSKPDVQVEVPLLVDSSTTEEGMASTSANDLLIGSIEHNTSSSAPCALEMTDPTPTESTQNKSLQSSLNVSTSEIENQRLSIIENVSISQNELLDQSQAYKDVCRRLDIVSFRDVPANCDVPIEQLESKLESTSYLNIQRENEIILSSENMSEDTDSAENVVPSAPIFNFDEEQAVQIQLEVQEVPQEIISEVQCMPLEVAMQFYGGKEMEEIREMSEREEVIAEAGSLSGPEHPLVDLLSTFRCSVIALEQERHKVIQGYAEEEKHRAALWRVEKRTVYESKVCPCGQTVSFKGTYDHAELLKSKLPAAKLRLEGLLKDVQESFCHHQHTAFLAYFQIEEFISETLHSSKSEIRAATALVLHELRMTDSAPALSGLLCGALRRWAAALCGGLVDARDPRHLLFLFHQLFRQSRSVRWAAPLIKIPMCDSSDAARGLALLELLLAGPTLESARECTEESTEMWEEVDKHGGGGAVSEGALRERDLLALLRAFPLQALVARLVLLARADITQTREYEWQHSGRDVVRAVCGVRGLLGVLQRAAAAHARYPRLRAALRSVAAAALRAAAALHQHNKDSYSDDVARHIEAELDALFRAGWWADGPPPPASLLRPAARSGYCAALMARLHEKPPNIIKQLSLEMPAASCDRTVGVIAQAAIDVDDPELGRMVLDFLVQTALSRKHCVGGGACGGAAREWLPRLLRAHDHLYHNLLYFVANVYQDLTVASQQPSPASLKFFMLQRWRPSTGEVREVLEDWSQRCPQLIQYLLQELSYTPYDGLSLEAQLAVGSWLCAQPAPAPDWAWTVLTRLRVHRSSWQLPLDAPAPEHPRDVFQEAYAVISSSWGHSVPLICEYGVGALCRVAAAQAPVAAHALPLLMAAMASSPESVSLTPRFTELVTALLSPATSLVQWAVGARPAAPALLLRRVLAQIEGQPAASRGAAAATWLHALRGAALPGAALAACDAVLLAARRPATLQEAPKPEVLAHFVRNAQYAPLACEEVLRATHAHRERDTQLFAKLLRALAVQRANNQKIHVDNALKQIGSNIGSEELVIYQTATAALAAPTSHPAHLALWALLMHLYLHTHTNAPDSPPIGTLFFDGFTKSRTLAQIKKRLQDTVIYHQTQVEAFKSLLNTPSGPKATTSTVPKSKSMSPMNNLLPELSIAVLVGESSDSSDSEEIDDSDDDRSDRDDDRSVSESEEKRRVNVNMLKYHEAAEKMLREFSRWLEAGSKLRATPHHADMARFIPDSALQTAWAEQLACMRPAAAADDDVRPARPAPAPASPPRPLLAAVRAILKIRDRSGRRSQAPVITSPVDDVNFGNHRELYCLVDKHLNCVEAFAKQWSVEASSVAQLDKKLWPLVCALRVPRPLSPRTRSCSNTCAPVILPLQGHYEWRISEGASSGIRDNRSSARAALRALCRARPQVARTAAALNTIARRIRTLDAAVGVAERVWACAGAAPDVAPARAALVALLDALADRWLCSEAEAACALAAAWCARAGSPPQEALRGALLARAAAGAPDAARPRLYTTLLRALPADNVSPQRAFSYLSKVCSPPQEALRGALLARAAAGAPDAARPRLYTTLLRALPADNVSPQRAFSYLSKVCSPPQEALRGALLARAAAGAPDAARPRLYTTLLRALPADNVSPQRAFSYLSKVCSPPQEALRGALLARAAAGAPDAARPRLYTTLLRALPADNVSPQRAFSYLSKVCSPPQEALRGALLARAAAGAPDAARPRLYTTLLRALPADNVSPQRAFSYLSKVCSPPQEALRGALLARAAAGAPDAARPRLYTTLLRALPADNVSPQRAFSYLSKVCSPPQEALRGALLARAAAGAPDAARPRLYTTLLRALPADNVSPQRAFSYLSKVCSPPQEALRGALLARAAAGAPDAARPRLYTTLLRALPADNVSPQRAFSYLSKVCSPPQEALRGALLARAAAGAPDAARPRLYTTLLRALPADNVSPQRAFSYLSKVCSPPQEALRGALLARAAAGAPDAARPRLYTTLLRALPADNVSPQRAFSYLSKFEVSRVCCDEAQRGAMLQELLQAAQRWGREPAPDRHMLVELIGVHTAALTTAPHLPRVVLEAARAAAAGRLPTAPLAHVARAAARAAPPFDQLGHVLRELGVIWWEARAQLKKTGATYHVAYAPHVAALQHALQRAFVAAACDLSYTPERVSWYAWAALQESWAAWVAPHPSLPPLLPSAADRPEYSAMLKHFVDNLHQIMLDCPGCEEHLLSQVWQWTAQTYLSVSRVPASNESLVQLSDLLLELSALPWREHQWWRANCLPAALQLSIAADVGMQTWVADTLQGIEAAAWLRDVADCDVAPQLAALLQLFAGPLRLRTETLEQAVQLPWDRLPELALDQALERFFVEHHNPLLPYHDAPQFRVVLAASGFPGGGAARARRACAVSQWTRAASAPALLAHAAAHAAAALALVAALEPYIDESSDELEELLSRAVVLMCMEPAAGAALPVWERWVGGASRRCAGACVCAARALTSLEYFAPLADAAVAAALTGGGSWSEASARLRGGGWAEPGPLLARARLHAAYALALASPAPPALPPSLNYSEKELIVSVWVCALCRAAVGGEAAGAGGAGGARAVLAKWAEPPRLAILRVLGGAHQPTDKHRLLSRLALCIITPGSEPLIKAYESACPGVLGSHPDAHSWARAPTIKLLPMLAVKLFPAAENYFAEEIKMAEQL